MLKRLLLLPLLLMAAVLLPAQGFVIKDVLVSDPYSRISDTEFDPYNFRMCWQTIDDNKLWVCKLDTSTWGLEVPDGKQTLVDSNLTSLDITANSGEWGFDQNGTFIVYPKVINKTSYISIAYENGSTWLISTLTDAPHRINPHATRNPSDSFAAIHYVRFNFSLNTKYKLLDDPYNEEAVSCFSDAHWAADEQLLTGILYNDQVGLFDPHNPGLPVPLTLEMKTKYSKPYMWRAPEHDNARMFFALANGEEIRVFKEMTPGSNIYRFYTSFESPSSNPAYRKIASPEPIVFQGQSYVSFMASCSPFEKDEVPSEIWLAKIDSIDPMFRMISNPETGIRTDPEPFPANDSLIVYYTEVDTTLASFTIYRLRKCETGIGGGPPITGIPHRKPGPDDRYTIFPNPFKDRLSVKDATGSETFILTNTLGKTVWRGMNIQEKDFSRLVPGLYLLRVSKGSSTSTSRVVKE